MNLQKGTKSIRNGNDMDKYVRNALLLYKSLWKYNCLFKNNINVVWVYNIKCTVYGNNNIKAGQFLFYMWNVIISIESRLW